jgi:hypothetical protein
MRTKLGSVLKRAVIVAVIVWQLALQLSVQSVPITTKVVSSNLVHGKEYLIQQYVIKFVSDLLNMIYNCHLHNSICNLNISTLLFHWYELILF